MVWKPVLVLTLALMLSQILVPGAVEAHEGTGFHPEALWALLRTGLLVAGAVLALLGGLWLYERARDRRSRRAR